MIELHQMADGRRGTEYAECRGRMPALVVMVEVDSAREPDLDLDPDHIGGNDILAGTAAVLGKRQQRRYQRHRMMTAHDAAEIVEIERVRRGAVDQRGVERAGAPR